MVVVAVANLWVDWWNLWSCVSNLIVLCILFLKANFNSNARREIKTSQHDENLSGIHSKGFSKSFGLELTTFPGFLNTLR